MKAKTSKLPPQVVENLARFDHTVFVLQGGGALGAYQAGVVEGFTEIGIAPDWIAGISIGAINAAIIAGNPPKRRVERLREFWERVSARTSLIPEATTNATRSWFNAWSAVSVVTFGVPGFFTPRAIPPFLAAPATPGALSFYDTRPLKSTLEELVDFDLINRRDVRLSLGAVNVCTGESVYFDNTKTTIGPEHVMASGALPPGFPPVLIEGQWYWDGGISSNTPMWYVVDEAYRESALVLQVDVFTGAGHFPQNLQQVQERQKDIQYASRARFSSAHIKKTEELRTALRRLLDKLPEALRDDPDAQRLAAVSTRGAVALVHMTNRHNTGSADFKDYEFSRATVDELWQGGLGDVHDAVARKAWEDVVELAYGIRVFDLTPVESQNQEKAP
ncbi:patatin-like phospholipase family protein [Paraburkholderia sp. JHI869]|uniref:patatin-like phospholipase family protein n=1 Tax=Paraburkholderia sp. JHI869 TaxID=3112959 RepID=UPI0031725665